MTVNIYTRSNPIFFWGGGGLGGGINLVNDCKLNTKYLNSIDKIYILFMMILNICLYTV